jgi:hypothetical protein
MVGRRFCTEILKERPECRKLKNLYYNNIHYQEMAVEDIVDWIRVSV